MIGFKKTGTHLFNRNAFMAEDFMSADSTNGELPVPVTTPR